MTTHRRIRPFNTKDTYPEQRLDNDLCQAVVAGNLVFLRGQVGQNLDTTESVGIGDVAAQTEQAMANIDLLLREAGSNLDEICKIVVYLVDPRYREPVYREFDFDAAAELAREAAGISERVLGHRAVAGGRA